MSTPLPAEARTAQRILLVSALGLAAWAPMASLTQAMTMSLDASVFPTLGVVQGAGFGAVVLLAGLGVAAVCAAGALALRQQTVVGWGVGLVAGLLLMPACCLLPGAAVVGLLGGEKVREAYLKPPPAPAE